MAIETSKVTIDIYIYLESSLAKIYINTGRLNETHFLYLFQTNIQQKSSRKMLRHVKTRLTRSMPQTSVFKLS